MKPIPTLEELIDGSLARMGITTRPPKQLPFTTLVTGPLFAAIAERDAEIERLRREIETIRDHTEAATIKKLFVSTQPEPAKPETCEHCGGTNIQRTGCPRCGAPVCCDDCCKQTTQELANPDPHTHLREAEAQGRVIQCNIGTRDHPNWVDIQPGCKFAFSPELYRVNPWTLPPPPEGKSWHRTYGWTEEMLPEGWRPLLLGEIRQKGDERCMNEEWMELEGIGMEADEGCYCLRTRRPLPEPEVWVDLGPEDILPGSVFKLPGKPQGVWDSPLYVGDEGVQFVDDFQGWSDLNYDGYQINRSLSTGKWDPNAWEHCKKLKV